MTYEKWDIVLIPFPFTDLTSAKRRPGLVISPSNYNQGSDILIVFITSNLNTTPREGDYLIKNWAASGLPKPSQIRIKLATIARSIIIKKLGNLSTVDRQEFQ